MPFVAFHSGPRGLEVPDATLEGVFDSLSVVTPLRQVYDLRVSFNLDPGPDGAFAGDLYMTLVHGDRVAVLLNRPGKDSTHPLGYADSGGFSVTLSDTAPSEDIHRYHDALSPGVLASDATPLDGLWQPDGRLVDPRVVSDASPRTAMLSQFLGTDPNGSWTLFVADLSGGGEVQLRDWSLHFGTTSVPDTGTPLGLLILAGAAMELARRRTLRP
ncbi:MAG: proprotein convertase P-domain-containing protein [Verrucomicrobiales bacterium]|nr:proprotein convertase P-domain-containing protein [Verrucomicrobiales bacterium]